MNNTGDGNNNDDGINNINNTNNGEEQRRKGKGRKRISMEKIQNETNLQVTFSKRRAGVFKKASELSTLCGAECAVVVFSPGNKPHSFGHPSVEAVADRFLINTSNSDGIPRGNVAANNEATMYERNRELVAINVELEMAKQFKKEINETAKIAIPPDDQLTDEELEQMKNSIESYKRAFEARQKSKATETSCWAPQNSSTQQHHGLGFPSTQPHQGLGFPSTQAHQGLGFPSTLQGVGFPAPVVYGYGATNIVPTTPGSSSSASFGNPYHNFGYTMPYPPMGPSGSNSIYGNIGVNPATVGPYDETWRASGSGSGSRPRPSSGTGNMNGMETNEDPNADPQGAPDHNTG